MSARVGVVATHLDRDAQRLVRQACQAIGCEVADGVDAATSLIVAGLPTGERSVPVDVAECLAGTAAGTPLVLLTNEALVRGHVVLADGRIHLLAPPHEAERLQWRLEHALAGKPPAAGDTVPYRNSYSRLAERWAADYWACVLSAAPKPGPDEIGKLLLVEKRPDGCFLVFPTESTRRKPQPVIDLFERLMLGDERSICQWIADLSGKGAVLAYDSEARELVVDLPAADECVAFLLSSQRLPNVSALPTGRSVCIGTAPGDILLAAVGADAVQLLDAETVRGIVRLGGVAGARELQQRFAAMCSTNAILLLEARA